MSKLLTVPQASRAIDPDCKELDSRGQMLGRLIAAAEKRAGVTIGVFIERKARRRRKVTLGQLRRHLPELFPPSSVSAVERTLRTYLAGIDQRIAEKCAEQIARDVDPRLDELWGRDEKLAQGLLDLTRRVAQLAGRKPHSD